jgi:hypothetical protein
MYIPYRKAYLSGMNPLSFVTIFTVGELITMSLLAVIFLGGLAPLREQLALARPALFWLFLGGFCWVLGDLFQQYAAKYIGIGRGIPLSNTNQLWGLAWGALVFGELAGHAAESRALIIAGSLVMIAGAVAISLAAAPAAERQSWREAMERESRRYGLRLDRLVAAQAGEDPLAGEVTARRWWDVPIVLAAAGIFVWLGLSAERPPIEMHAGWMLALLAASLALLVAVGGLLWKRTRFS